MARDQASMPPERDWAWLNPVAEPYGYVEGTRTVVAHDNDGSVGVELRMGARCDLSHGHEERTGEAGGLVLPGFADV